MPKNGKMLPKNGKIYKSKNKCKYMNAELKIIKAYFETQKNELYFNEIKEKTQLSNSSIQNSLKKLIEESKIKIKKIKSNTYYRIKNEKYFA